MEDMATQTRGLEQPMIAGPLFSFEWNLQADEIVRTGGFSILGLEPGTGARDTGQAFIQRIHAEDRKSIRQLVRGLTPAASNYETRYRFVRGDGRTIWLEESACAEFDAKGRALWLRGVTADVTARVEAEQRETQAIVAAAATQSSLDVVSAMGEGVVVFELDGTVSNVNAAVETLTGFSTDRMVGRKLREILPEALTHADLSVALSALDQIARGEAPKLGRVVFRPIGAGRSWISPSFASIRSHDGTPVAGVLTLKDVTELHESEAKYRELVENANSVIIRITPQQTVTFFNEYAQVFFGFTAAEVLGQNVIGTILPAVDSAGRDLRQLMTEIAERPELHGVTETENLCKDGQRVWVHWTNRAIRDERGEVSEILCVGTDITERKRLEQRADAYRQRLRQLADRLVAAEEQQRRRVATHIHDAMIQNLSLANIRMGGIRSGGAAAGLAEQCVQIDQVRKLLDDCIEECRRLMSDLTPPLLYELGLGPALRHFAERQRELHCKVVHVQVGRLPKRLRKRQGECILFNRVRGVMMGG
jgi:PAS domain S-box-containing protein